MRAFQTLSGSVGRVFLGGKSVILCGDSEALVWGKVVVLGGCCMDWGRVFCGNVIYLWKTGTCVR